jgi:oligopeptide transport system substrate-binding protein
MVTQNHTFSILNMIKFLAIFVALFFAACTPTQPQMVEVTEVVRLGEEQIIITRLVEIEPTPTSTPIPPVNANLPVTLDLAISEDLPELDPQQANQKSSYDLIENLFVGLTNYNHETEDIEPELAESWSVSADGLNWIFKLRNDIFWVKPADRSANLDETWVLEPIRPVNAHDVVQSFIRLCNRDTAAPDAYIFFIIQGCEELYVNDDPSDLEFANIGVTAMDDTTLAITLNEPASYLLTLLSLPQTYPVPNELVAEYGSSMRDAVGDLADGWQTPENIVTSGPFVPSATIFSDEKLLLHANPLWPLPRTGNLDNINFTFQVDEADIFKEWQAKNLDISTLPPEERDSFLIQTPNKAKLITNQTAFYLGFNFDSAVFKEPEIRRAFSAAIDRQQLIDEMFEGRALSLRHFSPPGIFGAPPPEEIGVGYSPDSARHDMDRSTFRNCKLIPPITFLVSTADLSLLQAEIVRKMWVRELDCDEQAITLEQVEFGKLLVNTANNTTNNKPDIWELAWPPIYPDAHNMLTDLLHCTEGENRQNRTCSEVDRLLRQASLTPQPDERKALYRQAENLLFGEEGIVPVIPLYVRGSYTVVQSWLTFTPALSGGEQFNTYVIDEELKRLERSRDQ